jgi:hypothetical protein
MRRGANRAGRLAGPMVPGRGGGSPNDKADALLREFAVGAQHLECARTATRYSLDG